MNVAPGSLEDDGEPLSARIDDPGLAKDGQHRGGESHRLDGGLADGVEHLVDRASARRTLIGRARHAADRGEQRALHRLADGVVGVLSGELESCRKLRSTEVIRAVEPKGNALEKLAQNNSAVASRPHQRPARHGRRHPSRTRALYLFRRGHDFPHRQHHIGPGVPVGHREDVERVQSLGVVLQQAKRRREHLSEVIAIEPGHIARSTHHWPGSPLPNPAPYATLTRRPREPSGTRLAG